MNITVKSTSHTKLWVIFSAKFRLLLNDEVFEAKSDRANKSKMK